MSPVPRTAPNRCMPVAEWPESDRAIWNAVRHPDGERDGRHFATHWSDATWHTVESGYGRWLTWFGRQDTLDAETGPAARVAPAHVSLYMADLRAKVAAFTVVARVEQLGNAMRILAPDQDWHWLQRVASQIRVDAQAEREHAVVQPLTGPPAAESGVVTSIRCQPFAQWPAADQAAWNDSMRCGDVLDPGGIASGWAAATQTMVVNGYGRWLTWLADQDALDPLSQPATRVTHEQLVAYLADLRITVASFTVSARIEQLGNAMRAMAPKHDWRWIQRAVDRIRADAVPVRNKRARLQSPDQLVMLGTTLMTKAEDPASGRPAECAARYRDGLLIALLAQRPMRARNLVSIVCGRHLVRRGAEWWLVFPAVETKTRQELEFPFPAELVPALLRYLEHHRPVLLIRGGRRNNVPVTSLWISKQGTAMGYAAIAHQVRHRTLEAFGRSLSPHMFRDCAATAIAIHAPEQIRMIQPILGHTGMATSERHYNLAGSLEAGRRHGATIKALRRPKASEHER